MNQDFFDLQIRFAQGVAKLLRIPLPGALLDDTNFYVRLGIGRDFGFRGAGSPADLARCFPFQVLALEAPAAVFRAHCAA